MGVKYSVVLLLLALLAAPAYPQQRKAARPELMPRRPECGLFLPARDEKHDLARLVRSQEFLECERDGFPKLCHRRGKLKRKPRRN